MSQSRMPRGKRVGLRPIREYGGEIFTDYFFGEANTANKSDKLHNNAKSENLNWGGFPGCYSSLPPTEDLVPRSRTIRGGRGERGKRETTKNSTPPTKNSTPCRTTNFCRDKFL